MLAARPYPCSSPCAAASGRSMRACPCVCVDGLGVVDQAALTGGPSWARYCPQVDAYRTKFGLTGTAPGEWPRPLRTWTDK